MKRILPALPFLLVALVVFAVFSPLLRAPFLFDDHTVIEGDAAIAAAAAREDGDGRNVDVAVLEFAGKRIDVRDGKAQISYADFIAGKHEKSIWVYRHGILPIPGFLAFE